ncbi:MAG: type 1 pili tip component [Gammaproteobacteria bacterium]|nr:type 1 pili tip component [Gammaproteobacteria bacterium]MBV9696560.1 type 1 pili tip component [Gammaproteobacteria bacterium]
MDFRALLESWTQGAAAPRTARRYVVRLPVDDAARLMALTELFPGRSTEQLISELLGAALQQVAAAMPYVPGSRVIRTDEQGDPVYEDAGLTPRFMALAREHRRRLQRPARRARRR